MLDVITIGETMAAFAPECAGPLRYVRNYTLRIAGAESNLAIGLAKLGCRAGWFSKLGEDEFGCFVRNFIRAEGVDTSCVLFDCCRPTGVMFKETGANETEVFYYRKNSAASSLEEEELPESYLEDSRIIYITGITPVLSESCRRMIRRIVDFAGEKNILLGFDPNVRKKLWEGNDYTGLLREIALKSQIVMLGLPEARELFGADNPEKVCEVLYTGGRADWIAVKNGDQGAWVSERKSRKLIFIPPYPCRCIDPIGAGDAFNAGFIKGILSGCEVEECGKIGAYAGALATQSMGDIEGYPSWEDVRKFFSKEEPVYR